MTCPHCGEWRLIEFDPVLKCWQCECDVCGKSWPHESALIEPKYLDRWTHRLRWKGDVMRDTLRVGRPRLSARDRQSVVIRACVTPGEAQTAAELAAARKLPVAAVVRTALAEYVAEHGQTRPGKARAMTARRRGRTRGR